MWRSRFICVPVCQVSWWLKLSTHQSSQIVYSKSLTSQSTHQRSPVIWRSRFLCVPVCQLLMIELKDTHQSLSGRIHKIVYRCSAWAPSQVLRSCGDLRSYVCTGLSYVLMSNETSTLVAAILCHKKINKQHTKVSQVIYSQRIISWRTVNLKVDEK